MKLSPINTSADLHPRSESPTTLATLYPIPLRNEGRLRFTTPEPGSYSLMVYDLRGSRLISQHLGTLSPGEQNISFHRQNLPAGTYLFRIESNGSEAAHGRFTVAD